MKKNKSNNKYSIIYAYYRDKNNQDKEIKGSGYFLKIAAKNEKTIKYYYVHLGDATTLARWLEIGHIERTGFKGFVDGEIILHDNNNILDDTNKKNYVTETNSYTLVDDIKTGKEVRQYAKRLVKAKKTI